MNHFPFFPKKFPDEGVGEQVERFLRTGVVALKERSLEHLRANGANECEIRRQEAWIQSLKATIEADAAAGDAS
jgi:hypothetical protein